jgi:hypothetical protein
MFELKTRALCASLVILAFAASAADADDKSVWSAKTSGGLTALSYGSLDANKNPEFLLSCIDGVNVAVLDIRQAVSGEPGQELGIQLSAGSKRAEIKGEVAQEEGGKGTFAEASDIEVKPILAVLNEAGPVTVKVGGASATLNDAGRSDAIKSFSGECELD